MFTDQYQLENTNNKIYGKLSKYLEIKEEISREI